jgi:broad specificity phosphatase PhoE
MFQSTTNPEKRFPNIFAQRRYDSEKTKDKQRIFGMRHGQTALDDLHRSDGWLDLPLDDEGRRNVVVTLAKYLKKVPITCIYTSPLKRTKETADILKSGMTSDPKIEESDEIKTWNLGSMAGDPKKPNKSVVKDLIAHPEKKAPDGESYNGFTERFDPFLENLKKESKSDGPFLMVLSGSACRRIGELLLGSRGDLDIDESGVFVMTPDSDGKWTAKVVKGKRTPDEMKDNPEAS